MTEKEQFQDYVKRVSAGADDGFISKTIASVSHMEANANFVQTFDPEAAGMIRAEVAGLREVVAKHQRLVDRFRKMSEKDIGASLNVLTAKLNEKR